MLFSVAERPVYVNTDVPDGCFAAAVISFF